MVKRISVQVHMDRLRTNGGVTEIDNYLVTGCPYVLALLREPEHQIGAYLTITIGTDNLLAVWAWLQERIEGGEGVRLGLPNAVIVVCEGEHGWGDYLQLHHFRPDERRDVLEPKDVATLDKEGADPPTGVRGDA